MKGRGGMKSTPPGERQLALVAGIGALLAEAVATINRAVTPRAEGNHGLIAALGAHNRMHLPGRVGITTTTAASLYPPAGAAVGTPFGVVYKASRGEELLLSSRKNEIHSTVHTNNISIC